MVKRIYLYNKMDLTRKTTYQLKAMAKREHIPLPLPGTGSGRKGRVLKRDIIEAILAGKIIQAVKRKPLKSGPKQPEVERIPLRFPLKKRYVRKKSPVKSEKTPKPPKKRQFPPPLPKKKR